MRGFVNVHRTSGYEITEKFQFEIPQYGGEGTELIAKATGYTSGARVKVVWDETMADLYTLEGKFIMSCPPALKSSQSHAELSDEQLKALGHHKARKQSQTDYINEFEASLNEVISDLGYEHAMAFGSNKENYNQIQIEKEESSINKRTKQRVNRDFNSSEWSNLND